MAQQPNPEAVINTLIHTFSADAATRKAAEEGIAQLTSMRGSLFLLVQVAAAPVREDARQAAAITVKNLIKRKWGEDDIFGSEPDSAQARTAVLDALMRPDVNRAGAGPARRGRERARDARLSGAVARLTSCTTKSDPRRSPILRLYITHY